LNRKERKERKERKAIGENNKTDRNSACHPIRQSNNPTSFPRFPYFPWLKNLK
jgi:hypothetical protein